VSLLLPHRLFVVFALNVTDVRALCGFVLCDDRIELADSRSGAYARRQSAGETSGECGGAQSESRLLVSFWYYVRLTRYCASCSCLQEKRY